ncbi:MAG: LamG domain-containing protein [Verrucomicrobiota bacterium]
MNGFDGTARGTNPVQFVDGKFGKAVSLDGTDQFIEITGNNSKDNLAFAGESMSVSVWFKTEAFDKSWQALVAKGEGNSWRLARNNAGNSMSYAGGLSDVAGGIEVADNNWHHMVAISDATGLNFGAAIYIDGVQDGTQIGTAALTKNNKNVFIGENPDSTGRAWTGQIDDVAIWNRVLAESEVATLYNGGEGKAVGTLPGVGARTTVTVTRSGNTLTVQWSPAGGTLETSPTLGTTASWTAVGTANPATINIGAANAFYRIRQ